MKKSTLLLSCLFSASLSFGQDTIGQKSFEIYGFANADAGYNFDQIDPLWYDAMRPSKLPNVDNQFGTDGNSYVSARQTRFGVKAILPTTMGELKTVFDFDLFGVGADAGLTTIRLRHAYGQLGHFSAGQLESAFMDLDVFPNTFEYWGPCGMLFFRNVQVRWTPLLGKSELAFALEMPGASAESGRYADRIQVQNVNPKFPVPDLTAHYRYAGDWGHVQVGGIVRYYEWEDQAGNAVDLSGDAVAWGGSLSTNIKFGKNKNEVLHLQGTYGEGIETYFNDAPFDVGVETNFGDSLKPLKGVPLPVFGGMAYFDHRWSSKFTTSLGYSITSIDNSDAQNPNSFKQGQYASANLIYYPWSNVMIGTEFQWIDRENFSDGFTSSATKITFTFRYMFSQIIKI